MAFNYVLIREDIYSKKETIIGLYINLKDAINKVNKTITEMYELTTPEEVNNLLLVRDNYFKNSSFFVVFNDKNGRLKTVPIDWKELCIQDKNGQDYIQLLKDESNKKILDQKAKINRNDELVKTLINSNPLPKCNYNDNICWSLIDLKEYNRILQNDCDDLEDAGDYDFYADTAFRDDQFDALDNTTNLQGNYGILVGSTRYFKDDLGELGKMGAEVYYPFNKDNCIYTITDEGIKQLLSDAQTMNLTALADWCQTSLSYELPKNGSEYESRANIYTALPVMAIRTDEIKTKPVVEAIKQIRHLHEKFFLLNI